MKINQYLILSLLILSFTYSKAQNLKDLRAKPDTALVAPVNNTLNQINRVDVPIPVLDLEVDYWKHWTKFGINANQASFSDNWSNGGVNSMSVGVLGWHKAEYNKDNFNFVTEVDLRYGKIQNKDQLAKKNNDRIFWDNKLAYKLSKSWAIYTSITFESQFDVGYSYKRDKDRDVEMIDTIISSFLAPGYFTESIGLEYKPDNSFSLRLGTGTARQTLVLDDRIAPLTVAQYSQRYPGRTPITEDEVRFGVEGGKKFRNDLAFQITANLDKNLSKNLNLKSRYNLFADYKDIGNPDHRLDLTLTARITRLVNVTFNGIVLYDNDYIMKDDTKAKVQYSQSLALGLTYSLPR